MIPVIFLVVLFVLLTPGTLVRLPQNGGKWTVALLHGALFGLIYLLSCSYFNVKEGGIVSIAATAGSRGQIKIPRIRR